jgi:hypothetical protein
LGLASFYRRLVQNFAETARPLTQLTRKNQEFTWGIAQQEAFEAQKQKLCSTPVLAFPDFDQPFILTTDASKVDVAAILSQVQNGTERSVAYASLQQSKPEQAYSVSEAELLAVVWAAKHFRCYFYGKTFYSKDRPRSPYLLKEFFKHQCETNALVAETAEQSFVVEHRAGTKIPRVGALSRHVGTIVDKSKLSLFTCRSGKRPLLQTAKSR